MIEITKRAAEAFRQVVGTPETATKKVRITFDTGG